MSDCFHIIIPSRYASTRLPGKALANIAGKPMIQRVIEQCQKTNSDSIIVATDDERISSVAKQSGATAVMTSNQHRSGTERIAEAVRIMGFQDHEVIVNVQGDEPSLPPSLINQIAESVFNSDHQVMSTAVTPIRLQEEMAESSVVKVVVNADGYALYFSRSPIPFGHNQTEGVLTHAKRHIGIYGYRTGFIQDYSQKAPSPLEELEQLEQLRVLWYGGVIKCVEIDKLPPSGVDTEQDLQSIRRYFSLQ